ncbi:MAG: NTP transferase domain-containing protein [Sulfolobales archaeon]
MSDKVIPCAVMAGGVGSRFGDPLKFMREVCGRPVILRLLNQLEILCSHVIILLSERSREALKKTCSEDYVSCIELLGRDYVEDLILALRSLPKPLLIVSADVVVRSIDVLRRFLDSVFERGNEAEIFTAVRVEKNLLEPVGLSIFYDERGLWINIPLNHDEIIDIDTLEDLRRAENVCR